MPCGARTPCSLGGRQVCDMALLLGVTCRVVVVPVDPNWIASLLLPSVSVAFLDVEKGFLSVLRPFSERVVLCVAVVLVCF